MARVSKDARKAEVVDLFRALADPTRLAIFRLVCERSSEGRSEEETANSISKIAAAFDVTLSTVSHHLRELRNAGLIRCEKVGQTVYCTPDLEALEEIERFLAQVTS
ncbi:MAG: ArsR/SmtB family transcription factor [Gaiellaceae bacterium]